MSLHQHGIQGYGIGTLSTGSVPPSNRLQTPTDTIYTPQESVARSVQLVDQSLDQPLLRTPPSIPCLPQSPSSSVYGFGNCYNKPLHQDHVLALPVGYRPEVDTREGDKYRSAEDAISGRTNSNHALTYEKHGAHNLGYQGLPGSSNVRRGFDALVSVQNPSNQGNLGYPRGPHNVMVGSSNLEPWSSMKPGARLLTDPSTSDELLFGLGETVLEQGDRRCWQCQENRERASKTNNPPSIFEGSEGIGNPPGSNPIGIPPSFSTDREVPFQESLGDESSLRVIRRGGRHSRLDSPTRKHAALVRKAGACWSCMISKEKCSPNLSDEICPRCVMKQQKLPLWKCVRTGAPDMTEIFLPASLLDHHHPDKLREYCRTNIKRWRDNCFPVYVTLGFGKTIKCDVTEFEPSGKDLRSHLQYRPDPVTGERHAVEVPTPPLGIILIAVNDWRHKLNLYLDILLDKSFDEFLRSDFRAEQCRVRTSLLQALRKYCRTVTTANKTLPRMCLKLIILTYAMTHTFTLDENTLSDIECRLKIRPQERYGIHTSPKFLNRELKFLLSTLHKDLVQDILKRLHRGLRASDKPAWATTFAALLTFSMIGQSMQACVRIKEDHDKRMRLISDHDDNASTAQSLISEILGSLQQSYHQAYRTHGRNPYNPVQSVSDRNSMDAPSQELAGTVDRLINKNSTEFTPVDF